MSNAMNCQYLRTLTDEMDSRVLGSKGHNLRKLHGQGFRVPLTFCLTSDAYRDFMAVYGLDAAVKTIVHDKSLTPREKSSAITTMICNHELPARISSEIWHNEAIREMDILWAVRSSSNKEDTGDLSFAGLYESYLDVRGAAGIVDAVKNCWASLWSERALVYRQEHDQDDSAPSMSVLVQAMVRAVYSGVVFTRNPNRSHLKDGMLVEYTKGLGDQLVSGRERPHTCTVDFRSGIVEYLSGEDRAGLEDHRILELCSIAGNIARVFDSPQDMEWAFDGERFFVLQTRPITSLIGTSRAKSIKLWTRANIGEVLPGVVTPLTWSVFSTILLGGPARGSLEAVAENAGICLIEGRAHIRVDAFLNSFCYLPYVTADTIEKVLGLRTADYSDPYEYSKGFFVRLAQGLFMLNLSGLVPRLSIEAKAMAHLKNAQKKGLEATLRWSVRCFRLHLLCTAYAIGAFAVISHCLNKWLPSQADHLLPLILAGNQDMQTAIQGGSVSELASYVQTHPGLKRLIEDTVEWPVLSKEIGAAEGGPRFLSMVEDFLEANGARTVEEFELAVPRWRENPSFVLAVIGKLLEAQSAGLGTGDWRDGSKRRREVILGAARVLPLHRRLVLNRLMSAYRNFVRLRENMKYRLMEGYEVIRNIYLRRGDELRKKGLLTDRDDIFFLTMGESAACVDGSLSRDVLGPLLDRRKQEYNRAKDRGEGELVACEAGEAEELSAHDFPNRGGTPLVGIGCSPGVVEGIARVLKSLSEIDDMKPGEILVTPHTDPGWTPLFLTCKAVVTEIGGFLSHGATIAREYGIPTVVNVAEATRTIGTGDRIRVDGTRGTVEVLDKQF